MNAVIGMVFVSQANPTLERIQGLVCVVVVLAGATAVIFVAVRAFLFSRKQAAEADIVWKTALHNAERRLPILLNAIANSPDDKQAHAELITIATDFPPFAKQIYHPALDAIERAKGSSATRQLALEIGRIYYGAPRPDGLPTTYDEQAIQNDISARTKAP